MNPAFLMGNPFWIFAAVGWAEIACIRLSACSFQNFHEEPSMAFPLISQAVPFANPVTAGMES